jgi:hypothetical protein
MFCSYVNIRNSYQLLYIKTLLSSLSFSRLNKSSFARTNDSSVSNVRVIRTDSLFSFFSKKRLNTKIKTSLHRSVLKSLNISSSNLSIIKRNRYSILPFLDRFTKDLSLNSSGPSRLCLRKNLPLRISNLFLSFSSVRGHFVKFSHNSLLKIYSSFFFLFSSSLYSELYLTPFLNFLFLKRHFGSELKLNSLFLNRLMINSLFFISNFKKKNKLVPAHSSFYKKKKKRSYVTHLHRFRRSSKQKYSSFLKIKRLMYTMFYQFNKEETDIIYSNTNLSQYESEQKRLYLLSKINKKSFSFFLDNFPLFSKLKLYKSAKLSSSFAFNHLLHVNSNSFLLYNFIGNVSRFFLKSNLVIPSQYRSFFDTSSFFNNVNISNSFLFSFYKKQRFIQLSSFLKRLRALNSKTYNLYINGTGSNYHSTFLKKNRVLFSKWSGLFGFKKRLKYRKGVAHKISYFFHRFISRLYKARRIKKLNININGFYKFAEIFLDAFARQIEYSADYALNLPRQGQESAFYGRFPFIQSFFYGSKNNISLPHSAIKSLLFPLISSSFFIRLNLNELRYVLPELSSSDLVKLHFLISNDNKLRSSLLFRWVRFYFYKNKNLRRFKRFGLKRKKKKVISRSLNKKNVSISLKRRKKKSINYLKRNLKKKLYLQQFARRFYSSNQATIERSNLVNRLIGIFMARYNLSSKKDFYTSVSYLTKYKSTILNYPHIDSSDFIVAYSIIYLLKILKQNDQYLSRFKLYSRLLRKRFISYIRGVSKLKRKISSIKSRRRARRAFLNRFNKKNKIRSGSFFLKKSKFHKNKLRRIRSIKSLISKCNFNRKDFSLMKLFNVFCIRLLRSKLIRKSILSYIHSSRTNPNDACKQIIFNLFKNFVAKSTLSFKINRSQARRTSNFKNLYFKHLKTLLYRNTKFSNHLFIPLNVKLKKKQRRLFSYINMSKLLKMYISLPFFPKLVKKSTKHVVNGKHLKYLLSYKNAISRFNLLLDCNFGSILNILKHDNFRFSSKQEENDFYRKRLRSFISKRKDLNRRRKYKFHKFRKRLNRRYKFQNKKLRNRRFLNYVPAKKSRFDRTWRLSGVCRLIRTRMRKFIQVLYSIGYVKYRASLSHGGCVARKRYYDKRYLF